MTDAWGGAWGNPSAWGVSWGSAAPAPVVTVGGHFIPRRQDLEREQKQRRKREQERQAEWALRLADLRQLRSNLNRMFGLPEIEPIAEATEDIYLAELSELNSEIGKQHNHPPGLSAAEVAHRAVLLHQAQTLISELAAQAVRDRDEDDIEMILISL